MKHTAIKFHALNILLLSIKVYSLFTPRPAKIKNQSPKGYFVDRKQQFPSRTTLITNRSIAPVYLPWLSVSDDGESTQETFTRDNHHENSKQLLSNSSFPVVKGVTLKMAFDRAYAVADASELKSERFTCAQSLDLVHKLRRNSDCVLVGRETVLRDDCTLTVRRVDLLEDRKDQPVRVVIDSNLKLLGKEGSRIRTRNE
jgi:Pyrimidine reductase, riboflavin biosynthesis